MVQASSDDLNLAVYAVQESNGDLELLVINKSALGPITGQFSLTDFQASAQAQFWQYGEAQDTAQSESATGQSLRWPTSRPRCSSRGQGPAMCISSILMTVVALSRGRESAQPAPPALVAADDSGTKGDGITDDASSSLTGTTQANCTVQLLNSSNTVIATTTAAARSGSTPSPSLVVPSARAPIDPPSWWCDATAPARPATRLL